MAKNRKDLMPWESDAEEAVSFALENADFDDIRGVLVIDGKEYHSAENVQEAMEDIYDEQFYANVPFDEGEAVFHSDPADVSHLLTDHGIYILFGEIDSKPEGQLLLDQSSLITPESSKIIRIDAMDISGELINYLAMHPEEMRSLEPRKFEELVAELFRKKGYQVHLTKHTRDGGYDVHAVRKDELGSVLIIIECKRYSENQKVGVGIVRGLYGVVEAQTATKGLIATTSYFTKDAKAFHESVNFRLDLKDYDDIHRWISESRTSPK
jgi:HJR/Mrr/RecB family endonuclease